MKSHTNPAPPGRGDASMTPVQGGVPPRVLIAFAGASSALGISAAWYSKLSIPAMMLTLIAYLTLPSAPTPAVRVARWALLVAAPCILFALFRFTVQEAAPGIVEGGRVQLAKQAMYQLREIRFAQDMVRRHGLWDPDGDGIGSAGTLDELSGHRPFRGAGETRMKGLLRFPPAQPGDLGDVVSLDGYVFTVYVPSTDGSGTSRPQANVDEERAERRWVAYAWPLERGYGDSSVVFIDEHERILISDNQATGQGYFGVDAMPRFDAALRGPLLHDAAAENEVGRDGGLWRVWRDKRPRTSLPGDTAEKP